MRNDDIALIERTLSGDETAFTLLVEKYQKQVHAIVWRTIKDFHIAEDIVQETFLKVHQKLGTLKDPKRFSAWINAIATRHCLAWFRENRLDTKVSENMDITTRRSDPYSRYISGEQAKAAAQELREIVKKWLLKLQESERTVVTLHYFDGLSCDEIAAFLGVTTNTIKSRLNRARNRLKKNESLLQSVFDNFQFFAALNGRTKMERKIRVCIDATTEKGKQFREGGASLIKTDAFLKLSSVGWEEHDKAEPVTMPLLGTAITPSLFIFPSVIGNTWTQEGFWDSQAETILDGYEQVEVSAGVFPTCLKHKSVLIDTPPCSENNLLATSNGKRYERGTKKESPFVNGTRYLWFAKGIGIVKTRYEHANGLTTEAELMEYKVPGETEEYHPLRIGSTYTYKYHSVFLNETVFEKWRVTENF